MQKSTKIMLLLALISVGVFATNEAYAQTDSNVIQNVEYVVVIATMAGALISVYQGYNDAPEEVKFSRKKLLSAMITAITTSMLLINFATLPDTVSGQSLLAISIMFFIVGYGSDKGLAKLDKG